VSGWSTRPASGPGEEAERRRHEQAGDERGEREGAGAADALRPVVSAANSAYMTRKISVGRPPTVVSAARRRAGRAIAAPASATAAPPQDENGPAGVHAECPLHRRLASVVVRARAPAVRTGGRHVYQPVSDGEL
jgi:hypothetical protein